MHLIVVNFSIFEGYRLDDVRLISGGLECFANMYLTALIIKVPSIKLWSGHRQNKLIVVSHCHPYIYVVMLDHYELRPT